MAQQPKKTIGADGRGPDRAALVLAAALTVEGAYPERVIAEALGISRRTLVRWKGRPEVRLALDMQQLLWRRRLYREHMPNAAKADLGPLLLLPATRGMP